MTHAADCDLGEDCTCGHDDGPVQVGLWPAWPEGVRIGQGVVLDQEDPALVDRSEQPVGRNGSTQGSRRCCAARNDGQRCGGRALDDGLLCAIHEGRSAPELGAQARREVARERAARSEDVVALQKLGTRAVIAQTLVEEAAMVRATIRTLLVASSGGDVAAAKAVIPYINQGLGMPTERVEHRLPSIDELEGLETAQLEEIVAQGRAARLHAVADPEAPAA